MPRRQAECVSHPAAGDDATYCDTESLCHEARHAFMQAVGGIL